MNIQPADETFMLVANPNNPKGLFKSGTTVFEFIGWFSHFNNNELMCSFEGSLPISKVALDFQIKGIHGSWIPEVPLYGNKYNLNLAEQISLQLIHFNLEPLSHFCFLSKFNTAFVFKTYLEDISITEQFTRSPEQAVWDYCTANDFIPEIMSPNRIVEEIARSATKSTKISHYNKSFIDLKTLKKVFCHFNKTTKSEPTLKNYEKIDWDKKEAEDIKNEPDFVLCSDYKKHSDILKVDFLELHNKIKKQAKLNGGFIEFIYKGNSYQIPKLPLLAWAYNDCIHKSKYTIHNHTWRPLSPESVKTYEDNRYHTDWWIGAGFPIDCYDLTFNGSKFLPLNKALSTFAASCIGKQTLDEITVLSGQDLPNITGNIVIYPKSTTDFNEGDIIILSHGGIEFDSFMKKACQNGNGAVIVEVGNQVAHLSIVGRELNYRLIMLPDARKLLVDGSTINLSTKNKFIKPL